MNDVTERLVVKEDTYRTEVFIAQKKENRRKERMINVELRCLQEMYKTAHEARLQHVENLLLKRIRSELKACQ